MAAEARRTWGGLRDELLLRLGRSSAFNERAEEFLTAAYYDICLTWHHYQLDATETSFVLPTTYAGSLPGVSLTSSYHTVFAVWLRHQTTGVFIRALVSSKPEILQTQFDASVGEPTRWCRWGDELFVDKVPDVAYKTSIFYYQHPTAPDFTSGSPVIGREWDEHILEAAWAKAAGAAWDPAHVGLASQLMSEYVNRFANAPLQAGTLKREASRDEQRTPGHGGAQ